MHRPSFAWPIVLLHAIGCQPSAARPVEDAIAQADTTSLDLEPILDKASVAPRDVPPGDRTGADLVQIDLVEEPDDARFDASIRDERRDADARMDVISNDVNDVLRTDAAVDDATWDASATIDASTDRTPGDAAHDAVDVAPVWSPVEVPALRVFAGFAETYLTARDGSFWGWGSNAIATFPPTDPVSRWDDTRVRPQRLAEHLDARQMELRQEGGPCALAGPPEGGTVWCWGLGAYEAFGLPDDSWPQWSVPHQIGTFSDVLGLTSATSCIRSDHSYWGMRPHDADWRIVSSISGFGSIVGVLYPAPDLAFRTADGLFMYAAPPYYDTSFQRIAGIVNVVEGLDHVCLLRSDGHVMCWGNNTGGQTGNGFDGSDVCRYTEGGVARWTNCVPRPTEVPGLTDVVRVAAGTLRTCALRRDGTVWCWGQDSRFPDGTSVVGYVPTTDETCVPFESATVRHPESAVYCRRRPTQIPGITDAVDLSVGTSHACVVRATGQVLCWGDNGGGQLGDGTTHYRSTPTPVRWY